MPLASSITIDKKFRGLFIGESGSGKTPSACSFVDSDPKKRVYVFDFDGRMESLLNTPWIDTSRIEYDYYPPLVGKARQKDKINFERVNEKLESMMVDCDQNRNPYSTIVLDSLKSQTFAFISDSLRFTHGGTNKSGGTKGRSIGPVSMAGPEDYGFESTSTQTFIAFLRSLPIQNIIVTCHIMDKYDKRDLDDPLSPTVIVGERLALRDKLAANIPGDFNNIFRFERRCNGKNQILVKFWSDIARTVIPNLPYGEIDITGKSFYKEMMRLAKFEQVTPELEIVK